MFLRKAMLLLNLPSLGDDHPNPGILRWRDQFVMIHFSDKAYSCYLKMISLGRCETGIWSKQPRAVGHADRFMAT